jgi:hypothetical protein
MAMDKDKKSSDTVSTTVDVGATLGTDIAPPAGPSKGAMFTAPIVMTLDRRSSKKGRKRYSQGTKGTQRFLFGVSKAGFRVSDSFSRGFDTFVKRSNRSARKRKDGYVRDSLENASRGVGKGLSTLGRAPYDVARRIPTRVVWNTFRVLTPFGN